MTSVSETIGGRLDGLLRTLAESPGSNGAVPELVLAIESAIEELRITEEELRAQNEELRETRTLLEEQEARYRDLFELSPVGFAVTDRMGVITDANRAAADLFRRGVAFLIGKPLAALAAPERRAAFRTLLREAARGTEWSDEFPFAAPDGTRCMLVVHAVGSGDAGDDAIRWAFVESPVTDPVAHRRHSVLAAAHRTERHRLSALLDRLHHAVVTVSSSLRVTYANSAARDLLAGGDQLVGHRLVDPWPEPSLAELMKPMFAAHSEGVEAHAQLEDGRAYDLLALPPDSSGDALLVIADVSTLERRQRAEREFVANAAHQLRTPVSAIASAVEVLQGGAKDIPEARDRFLEHLDRQCTRLVRLTRALLVLARAQALTEAPGVELVPLRPLLDEIGRNLRPGAGVEVVIECPFALAALVNRDLAEQAIGNLAENAAKYTVEGEITLCGEAAPGRKVRVVVSDTGPGADLPRDGGFHRFYRDPAAPGEGFGLGLAIAAEAVRALRGELEIESGETGTRAVVTLPAAVLRRA